MKSAEELYNKMYQSPKSRTQADLHHGRQDLSNLEARTSVDHQSKESEVYGETRSEEFEEIRSGNIDFRIQSLPHSTVRMEDDVRREAVKKLIHTNRESMMADLNENQKFNLFSEMSKESIRSKGNTGYFEMCEISSKVQCPDCSRYWETGIVYCTCGKCLQPSERNRQLNKERFDVLSIPNYLIKKNPSHGARHGPTERHRIYHKAHNMLRKAHKRSTTPYWKDSRTILYTCIAYDEIAKADHTHVATKGERSRHENSWGLILNAEGANGPLDQRDDYTEAKKTCNKLYKEYAATAGCGNTTIHHQEQVRQRPNQQFEGHEEDSYPIHSENGWKYLFSCNNEFFFFIILVATVRQLVDSMELGLFIME